MKDYSLGIQELDDAIGGIKKGSNIMLMGPPMCGKEVILHHIMYHGAAKNEDAIIIVATREPATRILERFGENDMKQVSSRLGIVDCVSKNIEGAVIDSENIKIASSPVDLTGIGVRISQFIDEFMKKGLMKIQLHIDSLSTILMYSNIQTVYKFLHVFTGRIKAIEGLGVFTIESGMHNEQTISILKQLSDGIIEITSENSRNFIRVIGFSSRPTPYFEYEIVGAEVRILGNK
jgi:KaiC/GvpD/RAD55 family RecA-like ATPase